MLIFLLVVHFIIAACLVTVILMQKSEGGGLGMGGSPSGLMSARGAADFLTRATAVLASLFVLLSIVMAVIAATGHHKTIDTSLARSPSAPPISSQAPPPDSANPFASAAQNAAAAASNPTPSAAPANDSVPLQQ
jgi:preprotein translocase subunit SecG